MLDKQEKIRATNKGFVKEALNLNQRVRMLNKKKKKDGCINPPLVLIVVR